SYRDLEVWQKSMDLVVECYKTTGDFPKSETYGLAAQLKRAAIAVPANIAEGHSRDHIREFIYHLSVAYGSLSELETHIQLGGLLNFLTNDQESNLLNRTSEIGRMINGLTRALNKKII